MCILPGWHTCASYMARVLHHCTLLGQAPPPGLGEGSNLIWLENPKGQGGKIQYRFSGPRARKGPAPAPTQPGGGSTEGPAEVWLPGLQPCQAQQVLCVTALAWSPNQAQHPLSAPDRPAPLQAKPSSPAQGQRQTGPVGAKQQGGCGVNTVTTPRAQGCLHRLTRGHTSRANTRTRGRTHTPCDPRTLSQP